MIRLANESDAEKINEIYNYYVTHTAITFDITPWSLSHRQQWLKEFNHDASPYKLFVYESEGLVVGFAYYHRFREKLAYASSAELTLYLSPEQKGTGVGGKLMNKLLNSLHEHEFKKAYSLVTLPNAASIALHKKYAFNQVGKLTDVGYKFDRYHSVLIFERTLKFEHQ
ncbi:N-acetyltransferase family protein [Thaumasiovibrio sp. DFM-14]|uniref:GNAT family N-acetyltransferase n=1 Tax=Thaumasiovibrio sp. DFM-14 TaxID=3384792 RepID=UPI00399F141D